MNTAHGFKRRHHSVAHAIYDNARFLNGLEAHPIETGATHTASGRCLEQLNQVTGALRVDQHGRVAQHLLQADSGRFALRKPS